MASYESVVSQCNAEASKLAFEKGLMARRGWLPPDNVYPCEVADVDFSAKDVKGSPGVKLITAHVKVMLMGGGENLEGRFMDKFFREENEFSWGELATLVTDILGRDPADRDELCKTLQALKGSYWNVRTTTRIGKEGTASAGKTFRDCRFEDRIADPV